MHRLMHISFHFPGVPKVRDLEPVISAIGDDWIRYSVTSWILWTDKPAIEIYNRIRPHLDKDDQVLIIKMEMGEGFGWLSPWIWTWINSKVPGMVTTGEDLDKLLLAPPPPTPPPWGRK